MAIDRFESVGRTHRLARRARIAALLAGTCLGATAAYAVDGTWQGPGTEWTTGTNWSSTPTVPDGTATFTNNAAPTSVTVSVNGSDVAIGTLQFNAGAPAYTFNVIGNGNIFVINGTGIVNNSANAPTFTLGDAINFGDVQFNNSSTAGNATLNSTSAGEGRITFSDNSTAGSATINKGLNSFVIFQNSSKAGTATITASGGGVLGLSFRDQSSADHATIINGANTRVAFVDSSTAASANITNNGSLTFVNSSTAANATITNNATLSFGNDSSAGNATITTTNGALTRFFSNTSPSGGTARFIVEAGGTLDTSRRLDSGTTVGSIEGAGNVYLGALNLAVGGNDRATEFSGVISDCGLSGTACLASNEALPTTGGSLTKQGAGTLTLSGVNTYTGATTVDAGTLLVTGSIAASSGLDVNTSAIVGGTGTLPTTRINAGGTIAPGAATSTLNVQGTLTMDGTAAYAVAVSGTNASKVAVTGTASLGGTVQVAGFGTAGTYTILTSAGLGDTTFAGVTGSVAGARNPHLSYDDNNVYLVLDHAILTLPADVFGNPAAVANAINGFILGGGTLPAALELLFDLSGPALPGALAQLSGEAGSGVAQSTLVAMKQFIDTLLDPFIAGREDEPVAGATPFAEEALGYAGQRRLGARDAEAYAAVFKAPVRPSFEPRWSVWASGYGGASTTGGDSVAGSHTTISRAYGFVAGADRRLSPDTVVGFALAGGGANYSLAQALGGGRSDLFQAGVFARHRVGPAYVSAALAYGWQDVTTNRTVTVAGTDQLQARFNANTLAARLETGYRWAMAGGGVTPYAAVQSISIFLPGYSESATAGSNAFALSYGAQTVTAPRTELGARADRSFAAGGGTLVLRGRVAWAHDFETDRPINATFQTLPGAAFTVNGASPAPNAALLSAGAEMRWPSGWSMAATFEGEFSRNTDGYAGRGTIRRVW